MNNNDILVLCLANRVIPNNKSGITKERLVEALLSDLKLKDYFNCSDATICRTLKRVFPDKPPGTSNVFYWLIRLNSYNYCPKCRRILPVLEFDKNNTKASGLQGYCRVCNLEVHGKEYYRAYTAKRSADKDKRTPRWADTQAIKEFYKNCPVNMQVDHIIPLRGEIVSGLHVLENLQYLSFKDNLSKSNKFEV